MTTTAEVTRESCPAELVGKTVSREYELFHIEWARGSTWTGYPTAEMAQATVDFSGEAGEVVRKAWRVEFHAESAWLYQPGVAGSEVIS